MMGPVELALGRLTGLGMGALLTDAHAVHQRAEHREEPEAKDDDADVPHLEERHNITFTININPRWLQKVRATHKSGVVQLQDNDEPDGDQDDGQVDEHHQTADAPRVGAERVGRRHGLYDDASLCRVVG